jgi:mersacidin/lichenicidin family type 2 lantibiotic
VSRIDIIRAWKDEAFRRSLSEAQRASLPDNPAGMVELSDAEAQAVEGKAADCCTKTHACLSGAKFL